MNKIDEIIQKWGNREEAYRLYRLVLFDYYLTRYFELTERKLDGIKHHGINDKDQPFVRLPQQRGKGKLRPV